MRSHVLRPLLVVIGLVLVLFVVRQLYVPADFGVHERGYTYGWYREGDIEDWKDVTVKYQGKDSCTPCHQVQVGHISDMPHAVIQCENCHGPARNHPTDPAKLAIDKTRGLCLRCHAKLQYPSSARGEIAGIDPTIHNPGFECVRCHDPHQPILRYLQSAASRQRQGNEYCRTCHQQEVDTVNGMPHAAIECEDCHGPIGSHPSDPPRLTIDKSRSLCLKCHDKPRHNVGFACVTCHDPHKSSLDSLQFMP